MYYILRMLAITATLGCIGFAAQTATHQKWGPTGIVSVPYYFKNAPEDGFDSMTFTVRISEAPQRRSFYYAQQFKLVNGNGGYIGIQPRENQQGLAIFSLFGEHTMPASPHCKKGADGGHGVSCSAPIPLDYKQDYYLTVARDNNDPAIWRGTVKNVATGKKTEIGAWKPAASAKGIKANGGGFVEYFPQIEDCSAIPYTKGFFGNPSARAPNGHQFSGTIGHLTTYGKCKRIPFSTIHNKTGSTVELGF
jgi:hypothetical protein